MKKLIVTVLSVLLLTSCGNTHVATVGDIKITQNEFEFYLDTIKNQMSDTELQTEEDWQNKEIEGKKAIEVAKQRAMDNAVKNALYIEAGKSSGISFTDDDEKNLNATKEQIVSGYGSEKAYKEFLKENGISDKFIEMMCLSSIYYNKIGNSISGEISVTDEELKAFYEENRSDIETDKRKAKHILIATIDTATDQPKPQEEQEEASRLAKEIFDRVQKGEDFDKLMHQYSEDPGLESSPQGYIFGSGEMVKEFEEATDSIGFGEVTLCKSEFGYHIIKRLPLDYEDVKNAVQSVFFGNLIDKKVEEWKEQYSIEVTKNEEIISKIN